MYTIAPKSQQTVKLCKRDLCIEASGRNAELIAGAAALALLLIAIGTISKALS